MPLLIRHCWRGAGDGRPRRVMVISSLLGALQEAGEVGLGFERSDGDHPNGAHQFTKLVLVVERCRVQPPLQQFRVQKRDNRLQESLRLIDMDAVAGLGDDGELGRREERPDRLPVALGANVVGGIAANEQ